MPNEPCNSKSNETEPGNHGTEKTQSHVQTLNRWKQPARSLRNRLIESLIIVIPIFIILLLIILPNIQLARTPGLTTCSKSNMSQISRALFFYKERHGCMPADIYGPRDPTADPSEPRKPLLSWRVRILPFMERRDLYEKFHLDEPWDSPHNRTLIDQMPMLLHSPRSYLDPKDCRTNYLAIKGPATAFSEKYNRLPIEEIPDGPEHTVWLIEVRDELAEVWTRPTDVVVENENKDILKQYGGIGWSGILVSYLDGTAVKLDESITPEEFYRLCTCDDSEDVSGNQ